MLWETSVVRERGEGHVSLTLHLSPCRRRLYGQRREGQHKPGYDKTLAETLSSLQQAKMEDIKLLLFHFSFPPREGETKERKKEREISWTGLWNCADGSAIRVEFSSSCKHEWKNSSFRQKKFQKIEYFFRYELLPLHHPGKEERKISSSKRILNISKKRETVFLRNLQMEKIGQRVTKREKDHVLS